MSFTPARLAASFGTAAVLAASFGLAAPAASAKAPAGKAFSVNVTANCNVGQFPATISGTAPTSAKVGKAFSVTGIKVAVTVPASITSLAGKFGITSATAHVSTATAVATNSTPSSVNIAGSAGLNLGPFQITAGQPLPLTITGGTAATFTPKAKGNVVLTAGQVAATIGAGHFQIPLVCNSITGGSLTIPAS